MREGKGITLFGDGSTHCDYTYIHDIIAGVMAAITYKDSMYEVINLGNSQTVELLELAEAKEKDSGITGNKKFCAEQPEDVKETWANLGKAEKLLGYTSEYSIEKR